MLASHIVYAPALLLLVGVFALTNHMVTFSPSGQSISYAYHHTALPAHAAPPLEMRQQVPFIPCNRALTRWPSAPLRQIQNPKSRVPCAERGGRVFVEIHRHGRCQGEGGRCDPNHHRGRQVPPVRPQRRAPEQPAAVVGRRHALGQGSQPHALHRHAVPAPRAGRIHRLPAVREPLAFATLSRQSPSFENG